MEVRERLEAEGAAVKMRARYTPRLGTWALWMPPYGWRLREVGFGFTLEQAYEDWKSQSRQIAA